MQKLRVAGNGDIKRLKERLTDLTRKLEDPTVAVDALERDIPVEWNRFQADWNTGIFGIGSLLEKILNTTLNPEQAARWQAALRERNREGYERAVRLALNRLRRTLDLSDPQVQALSRLVLAETRPPRRFGRRSEVALVLLQIAKLPEDVLRPALDATQWGSLQTLLKRYKPGGAAEATLVRNGFVFESDSTARQPALAAKTVAPAPAAASNKE